MSDSFDAYHVWLGIAPDEQPPHHYRLLAVKVFESNPDVIANAADQRMAHLRTLNTSKRAALAQKLLNEISAAQVCLLDSARKATYDAALKKRLHSAKAKQSLPKAKPLDSSLHPTAAAAAAPVDPVETPNVADLLPPSARQRLRGKGVPWGLVGAVGVAAALIAVGVFVTVSGLPSGTNSTDETPLSQQGTPPQTAGNSGPAPPSPPSQDPPGPESEMSEFNAEPLEGESVPVDPTVATVEPQSPAAAPAIRVNSRKHVIIIPARDPVEQATAIAACERYGLAHKIGSFETSPADLAACHTILVGSNAMDYWEAAEERKRPEAFEPYVEFVAQGGHLVVFGASNGGNMAHMQRFGIDTGTTHNDGFSRVPIHADVLFAGVENLAPTNGRMRSTGHFSVSSPHVVLLQRDEPGGSPGPALVTIPHGKGRVTFTQVEPHLQNDTWLISVLLAWVARGSPTGPALSGAPLPPPADVLSPAEIVTPSPFEPMKRRFLPTAADQAKAEELIREVFRKEIAAATKPADKGALAQTLAAQANNSRDDPSAHYTLLRMARDMAVQGGDVELAFRLVEQIAGLYELEAVAAKTAVLSELARSPLLAPASKSATAIAEATVGELLDEDDFDRASELAKLAVDLARKTGDTALVRRLAEFQREVLDKKSQYADVKVSLDRLATTPDDPPANLAVGSWLWFRKGDVSKALPYLAKGSDAVLKVAAVKELAAPISPEEKASLADVWYEAAASRPDPHKSAILAHALRCYEDALPGLTGLAKVKADKRIQDLQFAENPRRPAEEKSVQRKVDWRIEPGTFGEPANLGSGVNSGGWEGGPFESYDGLTLYFHSNRSGAHILWTAARKSPRESFENAQSLPSPVRSGQTDSFPWLSSDGRLLLYSSSRSGGFGSSDLWMAARGLPTDTWSEPKNLGRTINGSSGDSTPDLSADGLTLLFASGRSGGLGSTDIWASQRPSLQAPFGPPVNLGPNVNSNSIDESPRLSPDGLVLVFSSSRSGGQGNHDLWLCSRNSASEPFGAAVNMGPEVNSPSFDASPAFSADGQRMYFISQRSGGRGSADVWVARRMK